MVVIGWLICWSPSGQHIVREQWKHIILVCIWINCSLWSEPPIHLVTYGPLTNVFTFFLVWPCSTSTDMEPVQSSQDKKNAIEFSSTHYDTSKRILKSPFINARLWRAI